MRNFTKPTSANSRNSLAPVHEPGIPLSSAGFAFRPNDSGNPSIFERKSMITPQPALMPKMREGFEAKVSQENYSKLFSN